MGLTLGAATLARDARAQSSPEQIKPYVLLVLDNSGSMGSATGSGSPSCGGSDTRLDHAKCAITKLVHTYGDVEFGFGRFRATCSSCNDGGIDCSACDESNGTNCTAAMRSEDRFELLVPIHPESADDIAAWVDQTCGACSYDPAANPEVDFANFTPIGGSLRGAREYYQDSYDEYAATMTPVYGASFSSPIGRDTVNDVFIGGEQCRPYIVIMLTDGAETCSMFDDGNRANDNDTIDAVSALLATPFGGQTYRIETKPIGFGIANPNTQIEGMAVAGGGTTGFYAANEAELTSAFNQIITDAIKVEICNNLDDDCDGEIDEGFQKYCDFDGNGDADLTECTDPGDDCDESDDNCFAGTSDEPVNACGFCGPVPAEACNFLDDDCDGDVDEGNDGIPGSVCNGCVPTGAENCNNLDDDCNGLIDDGLVRSCGVTIGVCQAGEETCEAGEWLDCDATLGSDEVCDALDNDCDGIVNGLVEECYTAPNAPGLFPPCQPGIRVCTASDTDFGACLGEIGPEPEACDGVDNNCNDQIDEGTGGGNCDTLCGTGVLECQSGELVCVETGVGCTAEVCDGVDNDGDGDVDENIPTAGDCLVDDNGDPLCTPGTLTCVGGEFVCVGGEPPGLEVCDCLDNDCDGTPDNPGPDLCPSGSFCVDCACRLPCGEDEFSCDIGFKCVDTFCVEDPCFGVVCSPNGAGNATVCVEGDCVEACSVKTCNGGRVCRPSDGNCVPDTCSFLPDKCTATEVCVAGTCTSNPCAGVTCDPGDFCQPQDPDGDGIDEGVCVGSCAGVECPVGQSCDLGTCLDDLCNSVACGEGRVCDPATGDCVLDQCGVQACDTGLVCDPLTGECVDDPCRGVDCPEGQTCTGGNCYRTDQVLPDGGLEDHDYVTAGGGGLGALLGLALIGLAAMLGRRRPGGGR